MDKTLFFLEEDDRLRLIHAVMCDDCTGVLELLAKYPGKIIRLDAHGNTTLHFAVTGLSFSVIEGLVKETDLDPNTKNLLGESAVTWLRSALKSTASMPIPCALQGLARVIIKNDQEDIEFFMYHEIAPDQRCVDSDGVIRRALHVAVRCGRWEFANWLLDQPLAASMLNIEDSTRETPITLAKQQTGEQAAAILERMQRMQASVSGEKPLEQPSSPTLSVSREAWPPEGYKALTSTLKRKFFRGIKKEEFPEVHAALPCLYKLIDLSFLATLGPSQPYKGWFEDQVILHRLSGGVCDVLKEQITRMRDYWENIRQQHLENELFELSDKPKVRGVTEHTPLSAAGAKISINPMKISHIGDLWVVLIHEISHAAIMTYDHAYNGSTGTGEWYFDNVVQLAAGKKSSKVIPEKLQLLDTLWLLESKVGSDGPRRPLTRGQFYALQNADNLAMAIFYCLMAKTKNLGQIDFRENILYFDKMFPEPHHLEELHRLFPDHTSSEPILEVPNYSGNGGFLSPFLACFKGEDKKLRSASEYPKAKTSSMNLATVSGSDKSPSGSSIGSVSTAASPPTLPQRMVSFESDDEAMAGPSLVHYKRSTSSSSSYKKGESISLTSTFSE